MPKVVTVQIPLNILPVELCEIQIYNQSYYFPCPNRLCASRLVRIDLETDTIMGNFNNYFRVTFRNNVLPGRLFKCRINNKVIIIRCPIHAQPGDIFMYKKPQNIIETTK